jgi:hypothetical protein
LGLAGVLHAVKLYESGLKENDSALYNGRGALVVDNLGSGATILRVADGAIAGAGLPPTRVDGPLFTDHPKSLAGMTRIAIDARLWDTTS